MLGGNKPTAGVPVPAIERMQSQTWIAMATDRPCIMGSSNRYTLTLTHNDSFGHGPNRLEISPVCVCRIGKPVNRTLTLLAVIADGSLPSRHSRHDFTCSSEDNHSLVLVRVVLHYFRWQAKY